MRNKADIQKAHNTIGAALVAFHTVCAEGELLNRLHAQLDVLCYVLGCPNQDRFATGMQMLERMLADANPPGNGN